MKRFLLLIFILSQIAIPQRRFVDANNDNSQRDGLSWSTAWNSFADFDINNTDTIPNGTTIKIAPGEYNTGHSTYYNTDDSTRCIIWIKNNRNLKLILGDPSVAEEDDNVSARIEPAVLKGSADYKRGILILPTSSNDSISSITIRRLSFENFGLNPVKSRGVGGNYVRNVKIENCAFTCTSGVLGRNTAAVMFQYTDTAIVEYSNITTTASDTTQNDGIYIDDTRNIIIRDNHINVNNSYTGPDSLQPHVDCIQVTRSNSVNSPGSSNLLIENNYIENSSVYPVTHNHRQVIYADSISGYIIIRNNILVSGIGNNLINNHFNQVTDSCTIYNNTLVGKGNQQHLLNIKKKEQSQISVDWFRIKNNIFYKSGSNPVALKFIDVSSGELNNNILNHNLYYLTSGSTPQIQFSTAVNWNSDTSRWENKGIGANPLFTDAVTYKLEYNSPAKNRGLYVPALSTDYYGNSRPYWNFDYDIGAFEIEDTQLKIAAIGVPIDSVITHSLESIGTYWEKSGTIWIKSNDQNLISSSFRTVGNSDTLNLNLWRGWEYKWLDRSSDDQDTSIGAGFYKIKNNYNDTALFYLDLRDAVIGYRLNTYIRYHGGLGQYQFFKNDNWIRIPKDSVVRIWDINSGTTNTLNLTSYWSNSLISLEYNNHPWLIWGPYDSAGIDKFRILRKSISSLPFTQIDSSLNNIYQYVDYSRSINGVGSHPEWYKIAAVGNWIGERVTNILEVIVEGDKLDKPAALLGKISYSMEQNYPNPFNPVTKINFSIANEEYVMLKIYDILGCEVKTVINQVLKQGKHELSFHASGLSSGVYFYRISAGEFSSVKKMQVIK
jgi:hypothetical protein